MLFFRRRRTTNAGGTIPTMKLAIILILAAIDAAALTAVALTYTGAI